MSVGRAMLTPHPASFVAGEDLSDYQYHFVYLTDDNEVKHAGANKKTVGILLNAPEEGETASVALVGQIAKLKISETVAVTKLLTSTSGSEGEVVDAAGEWAGAMALQAGVEDDIIEVLVTAFTAHASDAS